jgi:hypothetical protein
MGNFTDGNKFKITYRKTKHKTAGMVTERKQIL